MVKSINKNEMHAILEKGLHFLVVYKWDPNFYNIFIIELDENDICSNHNLYK